MKVSHIIYCGWFVLTVNKGCNQKKCETNWKCDTVQLYRLQLSRLTCSFDLWGFVSTSGLTSRRRLSASSSNRSASALWKALNSSSKGSRESEISVARLLVASVSGAMPTVLSHPAAEGWGILQIPAKVQHRRHGSDRWSRSVAVDPWAYFSLHLSRS